jgi:hypothetical protein
MACYTISINELIKRPIIRNDFKEEWMNKMTDDELSQYNKECYKVVTFVSDNVSDI